MAKDAALFVSPQSHTDAAELLAFIRRLQRDDPLRPVTVVCPNSYAIQSLRHTLGREGFANVQFKEFAMLAEFLGAPPLAADGRRPLTAIYRNAVVRAVASQATGMLEPQRDHPATHMSLRQTFMQLRHASDAALDSIEAQGGLRGESVALYRRFRELTQDYYDDAALAEAAANAVRNNAAAGLDDLGFIVFFRVRGLTRPQSDLMRALAETRRCAVLLGETGDADADESVRELKDELRPHLGEPQPVLQTPQANVDADAPHETAHLLVAPTAHQEARWVIRQIVHRIQTRATPFHRIAVLYRQRAPYAALIREEFELAGIPVAGADATPLADTAVGRTLGGILRLWDEDFARDAVMEWLTGCPLKPPAGMAAAVFSPSRWDAISKRAGIVRGADQWQHRLEQFAANTDRRAEEGIAQDEISPAAANAIHSEARAARQIALFITDLAQNSPPADVGSEPWTAYSEWALNLLDRCISNTLPDEEIRARQKIEGILNELKHADEIPKEIQPEVSFDVFKAALNEALQAAAGRGNPVGEGVFVAPMSLAAAMTFDIVHIVGMIEGAVPPAMRDDPLIPERDRERAGGAEQGLTMQAQRKADERHAFLAALATAPQCTLSYPITDTTGQRKNYASRWLLEKASQLAGRPIFDSDLVKSDAQPSWLTVISSLPDSLTTAQTAAHADTHDYNLERMVSWRDELGVDAAQHPFMADGALAASVDLGKARNGSEFTAWDGNLAAEAPNSQFAQRLGKRPMSPTRLERWARCPFSYFLSSVLRLGAEDNPEDIHTISPLERGALLHNILEKFIDTMRKRNTLPAPDQAWTQDQRAELHRIADAAFQDAEQRGIVGKRIMWQIVKQDMLIDLDTFLDADLRMRQQHGVSPLAVEVNFGIGNDGWREAEYSLSDDMSIEFRGKIDRIDASPDGSKALVLDYKSGSKTPFNPLNKDPIDHGKRLQLAIYSLAAQQGLPNARSVSAAYWFVTAKGGFALAPSPPIDISGEKARERFADGISTILSGIRSGVFPANPGPPSRSGFQNCNFCDFDSLCPSRRKVLWERKSADSRLKDYKRLDETDYNINNKD